MNYFKALFTIVKKDVLMEMRTKEVVNASLVFAILLVIVFSFIMEPGSEVEKKIAGGIFWMAVTFSGILGLNKTMMSELEGGNFEALMLAPVDKSAIFFGKVISNMLVLILLEIILIPLFLIFYSINIVSHPLMIAVLFLATYGYALVGTLFSMISVRTNSREIMLPLLLLPIMIPILIAAILSTNIFISGSDIIYSYNWIKLTAVFDIIFTAVIFGIFSAIIEE